MTDSQAARLAQRALDEFLNICQIPRPSGHCERMRDYLARWADDHGLVWYTDGGNVWIDAPSTPGFEDRPKVVVQGHMDMVCVADPGVQIDFASTPVSVVREGDLVHALGTTLGADDGAGLAFGLALAGCGFGHGPLRVLATYDEETTMAGAQSLAPETLDADYVVNIDMDTLGKVVVSSAGVLEGTFRADFAQEAVDPARERVVHIGLSGFAGGHSGGQIHRGLVNAIDTACDAVLGLVGEGIPARIATLDGGSAANAIPAFATVQVAVPAEQLEQSLQLLAGFFDAVRAAHPEENGKTDVRALDPDRTSNMRALTPRDTAELANLVHEMPRGVLCMSPVMEGLVQTSANLGVARLDAGRLSLCMTARSCEDPDLDTLHERCELLAARHGMAFVDPLFIPAWPARAQNRLADLMVEGFERAGVQGSVVAVHGGLEPSWFCRLNPRLQMISCGPTFWGEHSTAETLDVSSLEPFAAALLHVLRTL